jgi:hypothetical protein
MVNGEANISRYREREMIDQLRALGIIVESNNLQDTEDNNEEEYNN